MVAGEQELMAQANQCRSILREMGLEQRREEDNTTQKEDGWTGSSGDQMDKVKTLAEKLDLDPCIVGDVGAYVLTPFLTYYLPGLP
jgi:hypothetical protein